MKTLDQVLSCYKSETLDGRDLRRLCDFLTEEQAKEIGFEVKDGHVHQPIPFTRENILKQLEKDVAFGFEKALDRRGISAGLMFQVVKMWNWILEEGLEYSDYYPMYGLPLFKATAVKYGFENPIGEDKGDEDKYGEDLYEDLHKNS